jgi:hypothetical protein
MVDIPGRVVQPALERRDAVTAQISSVKSVKSAVKVCRPVSANNSNHLCLSAVPALTRFSIQGNFAYFACFAVKQLLPMPHLWLTSLAGWFSPHWNGATP